MAIVDRYGGLDASWRGFPFFCEDEAASGGERGQQHQYPDRDRNFFEPLGRKAESFTINAYFIGPDADAVGLEFEKVLRQGGSGLLYHPTRGRQVVHCTTWHRKTVRVAADRVDYGLTFDEAGENFWPEASTSWPHALLAAAIEANPVFMAALAAGLIIGAVTQEVVERLRNVAGALADALDELSLVVSGLAPSVALAAAAELTLAYRDGLLPALDAAEFAASTVDLIGNWAASLAGPTPDRSSRLRAIDALMGVYDTAAADYWYAAAGQTPEEAAETANQAIMSVTIRRVALAEVARQVASLDFASYDEAFALRRRLADAFDNEVDAAATDNAARTALLDLSSTTLQAISDMGSDLARLVPYRLPRPMSAFAAAQLFYPDDPDLPARAAELVARNSAIIPAFLPVSGQRLSR